MKVRLQRAARDPMDDYCWQAVLDLDPDPVAWVDEYIWPYLQ